MAMVNEFAGPGRPWWESLDEKTARDPLPAIYEVQIEIGNMEQEIKDMQRKLDEHNKRLDYLQGVARHRLGLSDPSLEQDTND